MKLLISLSKDKASLSVGAVQGMSLELQGILNENLVPTVKAAKVALEQAIRKTSVQLKAWALQNVANAQKLGHKTTFFEKLVNNPTTATEQLAMKLLLGEDKVHLHEQHIQTRKVVQDQSNQLDNILNNISL